METKQDIFNLFMEEFVKLTPEQKSTEIIEKQKMIMSYLMKYTEENNIEYNVLKNKEINDIIDKEPSFEDYLEAMMVYLENIEELVKTITNN